MAFKPYVTPTGLLIHVDKEEGAFVVCITGDKQKELLRTPDRKAAEKYANSLKAQYEAPQ